MMQETMSILFYVLKARLLKNGQAPILLRVTIRGLSEETRIQRSIPIELWNAAKGCSKGKDRAAQELNDYIRSLTVKLLTIHRELTLVEALITPSLLLKKLFGNEERRTVLATFREHNDECRRLIGIDYEKVTINRYDNCLRALAQAIRQEYHKEDISFHELTGEFIHKFEVYMKTERRLCQNTLVRYMKCFKKITNMALANKWMHDDPFFGKKFRQTETTPTLLTMDELEKMMRKRFSIERLAMVRDVFVFCCFTGLAFIDASDLRPEHIAQDNNGAKWIRKAREKTGVMSNIPLLGMALKILEKYRDHPACQLKGTCLPLYSNQKMNSYLKEIADLCGIKKSLTTHVARHTFGTTVTLANNVSLQNVSKMMGHSSTRMTQHYARVLDQNIFSDMQGVEARLAGLTTTM